MGDGLSLHTLAVIGLVLMVVGFLFLQFKSSTATQDVAGLTLFMIGAWVDIAVDAAQKDWGWLIADTVVATTVGIVITKRVILREEVEHVDQ